MHILLLYTKTIMYRKAAQRIHTPMSRELSILRLD